MSIDAGAQVAIILLSCGPCVVIVNLLGQVCTLGRAPRTKGTLPDFRERCRVTQKPQFLGIFEVWYRYQTVWYRYHSGSGRLVPVPKSWYRHPMFCFGPALVFWP